MSQSRSTGKPFEISKWAVREAYQRVRANKGAAGVDGVSIAEFESDLKNNLYKVWNRMSSGTYFPPPVRAVEIPKAGGGVRVLGVPTVADRVAQTVVAVELEKRVEPMFHPDSYRYRPKRSALDAVAACRRRCWKTEWVLDLDIRKFFDTVDHDLNPFIRGWAAYYRTVVSSKVFQSLDAHAWRLTYKWASHTHPKKPKKWIVGRYYGSFNPARRDKWVFGDRVSGAYLLKFAWTPIVRHRLVKDVSSPDDPALARYWADRRRKKAPPLGKPRLRLLQAQQARCPVCGDLLLHADHEPQSPQEWEQWLMVVRKAVDRQFISDAAVGDSPAGDRLNHLLVHRYCLPRHHAQQTELRKHCTVSEPLGLA